MGVIDRLIRTPHRRCDDAPAPATRVAPDRAQRPPKRWLYAATQESTAGGRSRGGCGATSRFATSQETDRSRTSARSTVSGCGTGRTSRGCCGRRGGSHGRRAGAVWDWRRSTAPRSGPTRRDTRRWATGGGWPRRRGWSGSAPRSWRAWRKWPPRRTTCGGCTPSRWRAADARGRSRAAGARGRI